MSTETEPIRLLPILTPKAKPITGLDNRRIIAIYNLKITRLTTRWRRNYFKQEIFLYHADL
ncbi:MAG TPA: hypothetical protein ENI07_11720 [Desulfobacterales bacterium]|nr:hypothetical protein [Desulfobacterales bacterium]